MEVTKALEFVVVDIYCPECMTPLDTRDGQSAICPAHQARFQILFTRYPLMATVGVAAAGTAGGLQSADSMPLNNVGGGAPVENCRAHPQSPAVTCCHVCRSPVCSTCLFVFPGGLHLCPGCASNPNPKVSSRRKTMIGWSVGLDASASSA